ncbi:MAG: pantetheine-phosphate adenylyltransferase [Lachnospiraceae bacterium]
MRIAVYPGSFDPITYGHLDIIKRASKMFDILIVGVLHNSSKKPLFSVEERVALIQEAVIDIPNVQVEAFDGLLVEYAHRKHARVIVRGLRAVTDFEYELQMAQTNRTIASDVDTIFLTTSLEYAYLSSSIVKELASYQADISGCVPAHVRESIERKVNQSVLPIS